MKKFAAQRSGSALISSALEPAPNPPFTWVRWAFPIDGDPSEYAMRIRVTDGEGTVMDETRRFPLPDGATGWPDRKFEIVE